MQVENDTEIPITVGEISSFKNRNKPSAIMAQETRKSEIKMSI